MTELNAPAAAAEGLEDVPPPSAAAGDIEIDVPDEPAGDDDEAHDHEHEYEAVGGDDAHEERPVRKPRQRRYKIQEVIKVRQILLVQVVKEERGNKGAALTTYLSLAGRYCVLMPNTARGGGISRKITNAADRKKLKEISSSITVPDGAGLIIRTAGASRTKTEIKRDYEYLLRQWEQIRDLTLKSIAPSPIYEEGSLIKRAIRDLYSRDMDEILVDGERGYREAKDYMKMLMPSHAKNVKHYADPLPLFSRFQVESYLSAMFNPVVQLKSGGYIVIDVTEALVAIDVNSGRATREASIEDTALKTNLEAAEEAARQMRLRDLAGLVVIDFIDMEDRRNNVAVEKRLKDKLKSDRARIQVGRISPFGLLEMSRQRLRPGMIEATTKACPHCHGTGRVRSDDSMALALLREVEEEGVKARSKEVLIVAPVEIANYLLNQKREHIAMIEVRFGLSVRVEGDAALISARLPGRALQDRLADHSDAGEPEPAHGRLPRGGGRGRGRGRRRGGDGGGRRDGREAVGQAQAAPAAAGRRQDRPAAGAAGRRGGRRYRYRGRRRGRGRARGRDGRAGGRGGRRGGAGRADQVAASLARRPCRRSGARDARRRAGRGGAAIALRRADRPRRGAGLGDRRGAGGRCAAAPDPRAGEEAGDGGAGRGDDARSSPAPCRAGRRRRSRRRRPRSPKPLRRKPLRKPRRRNRAARSGAAGGRARSAAPEPAPPSGPAPGGEPAQALGDVRRRAGIGKAQGARPARAGRSRGRG